MPVAPRVDVVLNTTAIAAQRPKNGHSKVEFQAFGLNQAEHYFRIRRRRPVCFCSGKLALHRLVFQVLLSFAAKRRSMTRRDFG